MSGELLQIHVADGMSISVGRHVGASGQVVQNAHIIKLQGQWQLFVQESHNQPWRTYLNGHILPDNSQHSIASGSFISFSNQEYGRGGFDVENGWIKVGDSNLTMGMPAHQGIPQTHTAQDHLPQAYAAAIPSAVPEHYAHASLPQPSPKPRARKSQASHNSSDREDRASHGGKGKKVYRCTGEWVDEKTGLLVKCTKTFTTSGHLARHKRLHGGEKPYKCPLDVCNSRFSRHDNMNQHYRAHARKLGIEIVPQSAPAKESPDPSDEDDEDEPETPPTRGGRRGGGARSAPAPKPEDEGEYYEEEGAYYDTPGYQAGTPGWQGNNFG